jgi:hypothetical protein
MKITVRTLLKARRQALRKASPKSRDVARHKVRVLEVVQQIRKESRSAP